MSKISYLNILSPNFLENPYPYYQRLHRDDLIYHDDKMGAYFVGSYEEVQAILTSPIFTTAPLAKRAQPVMQDRVLAQMEGNEHTIKRRKILHGLSGQYFKEHHRPLIENVTKKLIQRYKSSGRLNLVGDFGKEYAVLVTLGLLDLPTEKYSRIAAWHKGIADFITRFDLSEEETTYSLECSRHLVDFLTPIVCLRKSSPKKDLISLLCQISGDTFIMSESEIVALCLNILLAATEPADKALAMLFWHLLSQPKCYEKIKKDRSLLRPAIEETLRLTSPVQLIPREASQDVIIGDVSISKGSIIYTLIGSANRDPRVYERPDYFDMYRWIHREDKSRAKRHFAFGSGTHVCIGAEFSMRQLEITANIILDSLDQLRLPDCFQYREVGLYTRGPISMPLEFRAS